MHVVEKDIVGDSASGAINKLVVTKEACESACCQSVRVNGSSDHQEMREGG